MKAPAQDMLLTVLDAVGEATIDQLAQITGVTRSSVNAAVKRLLKKKAIHVEAYMQPPDGLRGGKIAVYAVGDKPSAQKVFLHDEILESLQLIGCMSGVELEIHHDKNHSSVNSALSRLRKRGQIHINRYERQPDGKQGRCIPMYEAGPGEDAVPLKRIPQRIVSRKSAARHRGTLRARHHPNMNAHLGIWKGLAA